MCKKNFEGQYSSYQYPALYEVRDDHKNVEQLDGLLDVDLNIDQKKINQIFNYDVDSWFQILFAVRGRSFPLQPWLLVMGLTTVFILLDKNYGNILGDVWVVNLSVNSVVHSTFGFVLGFLIIYQADKSCDRWWEGRVAWENIITETRECMRILCSHCKGKELIKLFGKYLIAFAVCSKHYLRQEDWNPKNSCPILKAILPESEVEKLYKLAIRNRPLACLYATQRITEVAIRSGLFARPVARDINPRFVSLADQLGACERVLYTPLPFVYSLHLWAVLIFFLILTPLRMFSEEQRPTYITFYFYMGILSYIFLGLQDMSTKIQNPFGEDPSHLPLDIFIFVVYRDIRDIIRMKYETFNKAYTDSLYKLAQYEIDYRKSKLLQDEDDDADDGDD